MFIFIYNIIIYNIYIDINYTDYRRYKQEQHAVGFKTWTP